MRKNGFTLIELLAVIIILAVIALIATPVVLNVVENAKKSAAESSMSGYADSIKSKMYEYMFANDGAYPTDYTALSTWAGSHEGFSVSGEVPDCTGGSVTLTNGVITMTDCKVSIYSNTKLCSYANGKGSCAKD